MAGRHEYRQRQRRSRSQSADTIADGLLTGQTARSQNGYKWLYRGHVPSGPLWRSRNGNALRRPGSARPAGCLARHDAVMPIDEVRPGMIGVGRTVFDGDRARGLQGPHPRRAAQRRRGRSRHLILARLEGGPLARDRCDRGHERQPCLRRRPADRRGVVLDRRVLEGTDRRHHADRGDEGRDCDARRPPPGRAGAGSSCR